MTEKQLRDKVYVRRLQQGSYEVTIIFKNKPYHCHSNNSLAWDDLGTEGQRSYYKTDRQCLQAFYDECVRKNNL